MEDYERTYVEFWRNIVETDGLLDPDKVKRELHDYRTLIRHASEIYDEVTGGRISKPLTLPMHVIDEAREHYERIFRDDLRDMSEDDQLVYLHNLKADHRSEASDG